MILGAKSPIGAEGRWIIATNRFRGDAPAVAQVTTITITANDVTTTYNVVMNGKTIGKIGNAGGSNNTAADLQAALAASTVPSEFSEVKWTVATNVVTGTANTPGKPFTLSTNVVGGAGTIANSTTTTSAGPNDWSVAANWSLNAIPVNGDDVYLENTAVAILYGLGQSGVTLNSLNIAASYTGQLGLPVYNASGGYYEYRALYLSISATTISIGYGPGVGSPFLRINTGANVTTMLVYNTAQGQGDSQGTPALLWLGTHANNVVEVAKGYVGIAFRPGEVATVATLHIGYTNSPQSDANVTIGAQTTLTTLNQSGGNVVALTGFTTLTKTDGITQIYTTAVSITTNITTMTVDGGKAFYNSTGTITTLNVGNTGYVSFTQDMRGRTITNTNVYKGAQLIDSFKTCTFTNPIALVRCRPTEVTIDTGENRNIQFS